MNATEYVTENWHGPTFMLYLAKKRPKYKIQSWIHFTVEISKSIYVKYEIR